MLSHLPDAATSSKWFAETHDTISAEDSVLQSYIFLTEKVKSLRVLCDLQMFRLYVFY